MPGFADAAALILSDVPDVAAADVIGLGNISLTDVFTEVRAALLKDNKQLRAALAEDMAIEVGGLQSDLVDALTTATVGRRSSEALHTSCRPRDHTELLG